MTTLSPRLRPLWPVLKRVHRTLTLVLGYLYRAVSPVFRGRGVPTAGHDQSLETARAEPGAVARASAGPAYPMRREPPRGEPAGHPVFVQGAPITVAERYVLEIDGGRVVGDFGAVVTPGGALDYESSTYFGISGWREHPLFLRPTLGKPTHLPGRVLSLTSRGTATNYYHFLYHAIGRLEVLEASGVATGFDAVVVPHASRYQRELLELAGVAGPFVQVERGEYVTAGTLVVPSTPTSVDIVSRETVAWLRRRLMSPVPAPVSERIYITRGEAPGSRRYLQESVMWPELEARGFRRVDPGSLTVRAQIDLFSRAEIVVSPHGAGLANITFAPPGVRVLELFAPSYVHLGLWSICEAHGRTVYRYLVGDGPVRRGNLPQPFADISIDPRRIVEVVDVMIAEWEEQRP